MWAQIGTDERMEAASTVGGGQDVKSETSRATQVRHLKQLGSGWGKIIDRTLPKRFWDAASTSHYLHLASQRGNKHGEEEGMLRLLLNKFVGHTVLWSSSTAVTASITPNASVTVIDSCFTRLPSEVAHHHELQHVVIGRGHTCSFAIQSRHGESFWHRDR